jgi:hypothetical protein
MRVELSYEEKILNALSRVEHKRGEDALARGKKDFDAMREVLTPLYDELNKLRLIAEHAKALADTKWAINYPVPILGPLKNLRDALEAAPGEYDLYKRFLEAQVDSGKLNDLHGELMWLYMRVVDKVKDCCGEILVDGTEMTYKHAPFCEKCKALKEIAIDLDGVITHSNK